VGEAELLQRCLQGDERAWEILFQRNRGMIYRHCYALVHDAKIAEDLTLEAFIHAYEHLKEFRREARFSTWLWRIAHNLSLNYLKKQHPESQFREELLPKSQLIAKEKFEKESLIPYLERLPPKLKNVLELYLFQELSQKEIAVQLKIPYGTVRSRLFYARKKIKELEGRFKEL
jgi:RNA polymerase sigma-70 factor, ECF subfamily